MYSCFSIKEIFLKNNRVRIFLFRGLAFNGSPRQSCIKDVRIPHDIFQETHPNIYDLKTIFTLLQAVLVAIASISLIVASIGIMNTMLMSVMERTHEVGIMKAIGAKNGDVLSLFLPESGMVSVVGGVCGCVLGVIGANVISIGIGAAFGE